MSTLPASSDRPDIPVVEDDLRDLILVEAARPTSLRTFDQIPMRGDDLVRQVKQIAPAFAGSRVAFVGDSDGMSPMLGLLAMRGGPRPEAMYLLDFDERLLDAVFSLASRYGFEDLLHPWHYNVFDPPPRDLVGRCDWFYTNPPFGQRNRGASARLFISRGMELVATGGMGGIVLPDDPDRSWTGEATGETKRFLREYGWECEKQFAGAHRYHLDDDPDLASDLIIVRNVNDQALPTPFAGRRVKFPEIRQFYGRTVKAPYPHYVNLDGSFDQDWNNHEEQAREWQRPPSHKVA